MRGKIHIQSYLSGVIDHGLILAGGRSERFGRPKALVPLEGQTLVERAVAVMSGCVRHVAVSVGPASRRVVLPEFPILDGIPLLEDERPDAGPLAGIEAGRAWATDCPLVVLAVDLPGVGSGIISAMMDVARNGEFDVVCGRSDGTGRVQPLCGVWMPNALRAVSMRLDAGKSAVFGCMKGLRVHGLDVPDAALKNVNRPTDLG